MNSEKQAILKIVSVYIIYASDCIEPELLALESQKQNGQTWMVHLCLGRGQLTLPFQAEDWKMGLSDGWNDMDYAYGNMTLPIYRKKKLQPKSKKAELRQEAVRWQQRKNNIQSHWNRWSKSIQSGGRE